MHGTAGVCDRKVRRAYARRAADPRVQNGGGRPLKFRAGGRSGDLDLAVVRSYPVVTLRDRSKRAIGINDTTVGTEQRHAVGKPLERLLERVKGAVIARRNWHMPWSTSHREAHHGPSCTRHAPSHAPTAGIT